jgi:hypothetical protein
MIEIRRSRGVMQAVATSNAPTVKEALDFAAIAIKRGDIALGRARLEWILEREPDNPLAWLWCTKCTDATDEQIKCFYRVLSLDPTNRHALEGLRRLKVPVATGSSRPPQTPNSAAVAQTPQAASRVARVGELPVAPHAAGASTRQMAHRRKTHAIVLAVGGLVGLGLLGIAIQSGSALGSGVVLLGYGILIILPRVFERDLDRRMKRVEDADRGAEGEEAVGRILECLGDDHLVLHDVPSPYGNIDHIVISQQQGVFLIETKAHRGKVDVISGRLLLNQRRPQKDFIAQTLRNTYWLRELIGQVIGEEPWVSALLVFTTAFVVRASPVKGVRVLNRRFLLEALQDGSRAAPVNQRLWEGREELRARLLFAGVK